MNLQPADLHFIFDDSANRLRVWDAQHRMVFECEARNSTVNNGQYGHFGNCPRGEFVLGPSEPRSSVPLGFWFTPIMDYGDNHAMKEHGRAAIGIHGGGSGLAHPYAPEQGWMITEGCIRVFNSSNEMIARRVRAAAHAGGTVYFTVTGAA